jgi:phosphoserine phosphatase RsbU/P
VEQVNGEVGALLEEIAALRTRVAELERWNGAAERAAENFASERKRAEDELLRANQRMRADLDAAAEVQESLLPSPSIEIPGLDVGWQVRPSERLGGDLLDLYRVDDEHVGMYVVDVSGHGVSAAMLSIAIQRVMAQTTAEAALLSNGGEGHGRNGNGPARPAEVCRLLNATFPRNPITGQYCTLLYGLYNLRTHVFRFSSAGHSPPILVTPDGRARELVLPGAPIGVWPDSEFEEIEVVVPPGSRIYLYSDGILDVFGAEGQAYGVERLLGDATELHGHDVRTSVTRMIEAALAWNAGEVPLDDISLLAFEAGSPID